MIETQDLVYLGMLTKEGTIILTKQDGQHNLSGVSLDLAVLSSISNGIIPTEHANQVKTMAFPPLSYYLKGTLGIVLPSFLPQHPVFAAKLKDGNNRTRFVYSVAVNLNGQRPQMGSVKYATPIDVARLAKGLEDKESLVGNSNGPVLSLCLAMLASSINTNLGQRKTAERIFAMIKKEHPDIFIYSSAQ